MGLMDWLTSLRRLRRRMPRAHIPVVSCGLNSPLQRLEARVCPTALSIAIPAAHTLAMTYQADSGATRIARFDAAGNLAQDEVLSSSDAALITEISIQGDAGQDVIDLTGFLNARHVSINGGDGNDSISGSPGPDVLVGGAGDDCVFGSAGNDSISGGVGDDSLYGGSQNDSISAGAGNDLVTGDAGNDTLHGDGGVDSLYGNGGNDSLEGGDDPNFLNGHGGDDTLRGGSDADVARGGEGRDVLFGEAGRDLLFGDQHNDDLWGGPGDDILVGAQDNDRLRGDEGNDQLLGGLGGDTLSGDSDQDRLLGEGGNDVLDGGAGIDSLSGGLDDDTLTGGSGDVDLAVENLSYLSVVIDASPTRLQIRDSNGLTPYGSDQLSEIELVRIFGDDRANTINGSTSTLPLSIFGGNGADTINGGLRNDTIYGQNGNDVVLGGRGNDRIFGDDLTSDASSLPGNDLVFGNDGNDVMYGNDGNDTLDAGAGADSLGGGLGTDSVDGGDGMGDVVVESLDLALAYVDATATALTIRNASGVTSFGADLLTRIEAAKIVGSDGANRIDASNSDLPLSIHGAGGADSLVGGRGNDSLYGQAGRDTLLGGRGNDRMWGDDAVFDGINLPSNDTLYGNEGDDTLTGGGGLIDYLYGQAGNDTISETTDSTVTVARYALLGAEAVMGTRIFDDTAELVQVIGGPSNNVIDARESLVPVSLEGGDGNDTLIGSRLNDTLLSGSGADILNVGSSTGDVEDFDVSVDRHSVNPMRIVVIGDSTAQSYSLVRDLSGDLVENSLGGWGQSLVEGFDAAQVVVVNQAISGRTAKEFYDEGRWRVVLDSRPDYVLMQFGRNEYYEVNRQKPPKPAAQSLAEYESNLARMVSEAQGQPTVDAAGNPLARTVRPVLVTPTPKFTLDLTGQLVASDMQDYADAMLSEDSSPLDVLRIDAHAATLQLQQELGVLGTLVLFSAGDMVHFSPWGAGEIADLIREELTQSIPELQQLLID